MFPIKNDVRILPILFIVLSVSISLFPSTIQPSNCFDFHSNGSSPSSFIYFENSSTSQVATWFDTIPSTILTCSDTFQLESTQDTYVVLGGYSSKYGQQNAQLRIGNISKSEIDILDDEILLNNTTSRITQVEIATNNLIVAGGQITAIDEDYFLFVTFLNEEQKFVTNTSVSWFITNPERTLRQIKLIEDENKILIITVETNYTQVSPIYSRVYQIENNSSISLLSETQIDAAVPVTFCATSNSSINNLDFIVAARVQGFMNVIALYNLENSSGSMMTNFLSNFSISVDQLYSRQLMIDSSSTNYPYQMLLLGEELNNSLKTPFILEIMVLNKNSVSWGQYSQMGDTTLNYESEDAFFVDFDNNGIFELIWQITASSQLGDSIHKEIWLVDLEFDPTLIKVTEIDSTATLKAFATGASLSNDNSFLLSCGYIVNGTENYAQLDLLSIHPFSITIELERRVWIFGGTLDGLARLEWWSGDPVSSLLINFLLLDSINQEISNQSSMTDEIGYTFFSHQLPYVEEPMFYNFSISSNLNGWSSDEILIEVWLDWFDEISFDFSFHDSYGGKVSGNLYLQNLFSRNETFLISIVDPTSSLRSFRDYRNPTILEQQGDQLASLSVSRSNSFSNAWNNTPFTLTTMESIDLVFDATIKVDHSVSLTLNINSSLISYPFVSIRITSEEIWFSPLFQLTILVLLSLLLSSVFFIGYQMKRKRQQIQMLSSLPRIQPIDLAQVSVQLQRSQPLVTRLVLKTIPGFISKSNSNLFFPSQYLTIMTQELLELESVKSIVELSDQLDIHFKEAKILIADLRYRAIKEDNKKMKNNLRLLLVDSSMIKKLGLKDVDGEYLLEEPILATPQEVEVDTRPVACIYCGELLHGTKSCPSCHKERLKCSICRLTISFGEQTTKCPSCSAMFHQAHLDEWLKIKGNCPVCGQNI